MSTDRQPMEFRATGGDLFGFWLVSLLLTIVTFGIYGFWRAKAMKKWMAEHTYVHGKPLKYESRLGEFILFTIVRGFLMVITFAIYTPWALCKGTRFQWRCTTVADGRTCAFDGQGGDFGMQFFLNKLLTLCTLGIARKWVFVRQTRWEQEHTLIGGERIEFVGTTGGVRWVMLKNALFTLLTLGFYRPWARVNIERWICENSLVARGTDTTPAEPDAMDAWVAARAADPKTWYAVGGLAAAVVLLFLLVGLVSTVGGWIATLGDRDDVEEVVSTGDEPRPGSGRSDRSTTPVTEPATPAPGAVVAYSSPTTGYTMARIEPGEYWMGSPSNEAHRDDDEARHKVTLTHAYYVGTHEVTQQQYRSVMGTNPSKFSGDLRPVEMVEWFDAVAFANELSRNDGLDPAYKILGKNVTWIDGANGYRLPTEAEWECAARAGQSLLYAGSGNASAVGWYVDNSYGSTHEVGAKLPNGWGLYDMTGNVWEWVWDWHGGYQDYAVDPRGPLTGDERCYRGGSHDEQMRHVRLANRGFYYPDKESDDKGIRLVRNAD